MNHVGAAFCINFFYASPQDASILWRFQRLYLLTGVNIKRRHFIISLKIKLLEGFRFVNSSLTLCRCNPVLSLITNRCSVKQPAFNGTRQRTSNRAKAKA